MLQEFEARKGAQLAVLLVPSTKPEEIEQYALRVGEQWKLGRKKVDDAAILVVAKDDRTLRIEVGYGLEGALNDATAARIKNSGGANFALNGATTAANASSTGYDLGLRHAF